MKKLVRKSQNERCPIKSSLPRGSRSISRLLCAGNGHRNYFRCLFPSRNENDSPCLTCHQYHCLRRPVLVVTLPPPVFLLTMKTIALVLLVINIIANVVLCLLL